MPGLVSTHSLIAAIPKGRRHALFASVRGRVAAWRKDDDVKATWHVAPPRVRMVGEAEFRDGAVVRLNGVYQDITPSHAMRQDLEKTHELSRVTLDSIRDATRRHHLEESVRQMQRMDAVGGLTAGVAHDFNNLPQASLGPLDLLADNESLDSEALECVAMADSAADRGATLVHRLPAFSRKQSLDPVLLRAEEVFADLAILLSSTLGRRIQVATEVQPDAWPIRADSVQLENCLFNLAINARDAMPAGGRLTLRADNAGPDAAPRAGLPEGFYVRFSVTDTGTGMTEAVRQQALEPFFTTKAIGKGTGLGLSMVQGFARQSGGDVLIVSTPGEGTSVTLWLPRAEAEALTATQQAAPPTRSAPAGRTCWSWSTTTASAACWRCC